VPTGHRPRVLVVGVAPKAAQSPSASIVLTARQSILAAAPQYVRRPQNVATLERNISCVLFCIRRRGFVLEPLEKSSA